MYEYQLPNRPAAALEHAEHVTEEWHAYVCDLTDAPSWVTGADSGICCHTCQLILVERHLDADWPEHRTADDMALDIHTHVDAAMSHFTATELGRAARTVMELRKAQAGVR